MNGQRRLRCVLAARDVRFRVLRLRHGISKSFESNVFSFWAKFNMTGAVCRLHLVVACSWHHSQSQSPHSLTRIVSDCATIAFGLISSTLQLHSHTVARAHTHHQLIKITPIEQQTALFNIRMNSINQSSRCQRIDVLCNFNFSMFEIVVNVRPCFAHTHTHTRSFSFDIEKVLAHFVVARCRRHRRE